MHYRILYTASLMVTSMAVSIMIHVAAHGQPVIFSVETDRGNDTLYVAEPSRISFMVDGQGAEIQGLTFPLEFQFGNGSLIGTTPDPAGLEFMVQDSNYAHFAPLVIVPYENLKGANPDTLLYGFTSFGGPFVTSGAEFIWGIAFQPLDTGQILIDTIFLPPVNSLGAADPNAQTLSIEWYSNQISVLPCPNVLGDVTQDGVVTSSDIIYLVMCVFKCGPGPFDILDLGNVDCGPATTSADVIRLVNYVFKGIGLPFCCIVLDD